MDRKILANDARHALQVREGRRTSVEGRNPSRPSGGIRPFAGKCLIPYGAAWTATPNAFHHKTISNHLPGVLPRIPAGYPVQQPEILPENRFLPWTAFCNTFLGITKFLRENKYHQGRTGPVCVLVLHLTYVLRRRSRRQVKGKKRTHERAQKLHEKNVKELWMFTLRPQSYVDKSIIELILNLRTPHTEAKSSLFTSVSYTNDSSAYYCHNTKL